MSSPLLWGGIAAAGFYALIEFLPFDVPLVRRYFCGHPIEYITTALYFVGTAMLVLKALRLPAERAAFEQPLLDGLREIHSAPATGRSEHGSHAESAAVLRAQTLQRRVGDWPPHLRDSVLGRRICELCAFISGRRSSSGLEDHLKYLAELAAEQLHGSYALVRTITWAVPILGFLGTVIGITMAIANLTPEQLDASLSTVTGGLAVAFDTTALSLALSLVLVFCSFVTERAEQQILSRVEDYGVARLAHLFPESSAEVHTPLALAEQQAAAQLLDRTETLIAEQTQLWQQSLEAIRSRWNESLESQARQLDAALQDGMSATLTHHAELLAGIRSEFLQGLQAATEQFARYALALQQHGEALAQLTGQEEQLLRLEDRLARNLEAVRGAEAFDQTLHNLTAAVHLLTARSKPAAA